MNLKKHKKHKLLFDEGLPPAKSYPELNSFYDISHVASDKKLRGKTDTTVYGSAHKEKRIPVVFNTKDFKPLITSKTVSVISLSTNLTNKQADIKIVKALRKLKLIEEKGCLISISESGITIRKVLEP